MLGGQRTHGQTRLNELRHRPVLMAFSPQDVGRHDGISGVRPAACLMTTFSIACHGQGIGGIDGVPRTRRRDHVKFLSVSIATAIEVGSSLWFAMTRRQFAETTAPGANAHLGNGPSPSTNASHRGVSGDL
jgi:hypothetical protein